MAFPLVRHTSSMLGSSKCQILSVINLKNAFHSWRLTEELKYHGILPYFDSATYLYQRMQMGLNISPTIWQLHLNTILDCLQSRRYHEAIVDDCYCVPDNKSPESKVGRFAEGLTKDSIEDF